MIAAVLLGTGVKSSAQTVTLRPPAVPCLGAVDERYQSYNVEMVEVTGGRFWKPYGSNGAVKPPSAQAAPAAGEISPDLYEYRPPIDLSNARLRQLVAALGPAYIRVSGTWANSVYFHDSEDPLPPAPPAGFNNILTRQQWKGAVDFARAVNARIVTSFAVSAGEGGVLASAQRPAVELNGKPLEAASDGALPPLAGAPLRPGRVVLPAASIGFIAFPPAGNNACR